MLVFGEMRRLGKMGRGRRTPKSVERVEMKTNKADRHIYKTQKRTPTFRDCIKKDIKKLLKTNTPESEKLKKEIRDALHTPKN
jgi:hypothetical protein